MFFFYRKVQGTNVKYATNLAWREIVMEAIYFPVRYYVILPKRRNEQRNS